MSPQHPTSSPKLCSDTSTSENSSYCFNKQASLDEKILQILDDLLNPFQWSESTSQGIKVQVNKSFQNSYTTSESRLTMAIFNHNHRVLTPQRLGYWKKVWILLLYIVRLMSQNVSKSLITFVVKCA